MIKANGWGKYSIWEHSARVKALYTRRCTLEEEEMTCAAQAAELLAPCVSDGDTLLDAGCGSGYFFHSLQKRGIPVKYFGIDASPSLVEIGRKHLVAFGLPPEQLQVIRIEDLNADVHHIVCLNVLSNIDNYHRPLERLLRCASKTLILRESSRKEGCYAYVPDKYLDSGIELNVHVNTYPTDELTAFMRSYGFTVRCIQDRHSLGDVEMVIDHPHYWTFFVAERTSVR